MHAVDRSIIGEDFAVIVVLYVRNIAFVFFIGIAASNVEMKRYHMVVCAVLDVRHG